MNISTESAQQIPTFGSKNSGLIPWRTRKASGKAGLPFENFWPTESRLER